MPESPPGLVLEAVRTRRIVAVASWDLAEEIVDVLRRPQLRRYGIEERDVREVLFLLAPFLPTAELTAPLRDPNDAPVIGAAVEGSAELIVTGDRDFLADEDVLAWLAERGIEVLAPAAFLERLASE
jgi:putative PIN family toxin of toxin-antitoxin system